MPDYADGKGSTMASMQTMVILMLVIIIILVIIMIIILYFFKALYSLQMNVQQDRFLSLLVFPLHKREN